MIGLLTQVKTIAEEMRGKATRDHKMMGNTINAILHGDSDKEMVDHAMAQMNERSDALKKAEIADAIIGKIDGALLLLESAPNF